MKKRKNNRGLIAVIGALSAATMVSVGFASWILSGTDEASVGGSISVETISDSELYLFTNADAELGNQSIAFGHPKETVENAWLTFSEGVEESLTATWSVTVSNVTSTNYQSVVQALAVTSTGGGSVTVGNETKTGYAGALSLGYVGALPTPVIGWENGKVTVTVTFTWGSAFELDNTPVNPYNYYNSTGKSLRTHGLEAQERLANLQTLLTGASYSFTLKTVVPQGN